MIFPAAVPGSAMAKRRRRAELRAMRTRMKHMTLEQAGCLGVLDEVDTLAENLTGWPGEIGTQ